MKKLKIILGVFIIMFIFSGCSLKELFVSEEEKGKHSREIDAEYEIKTTEDEYFLYINYWPTNSIDSKNEGVYSLKLVTMEERNNTPDFDPGSINKIPGIYYPDDDE